MSSVFFASVLLRLKQLTGTNTDVQLARALNVSPQTLSSWKMRASIPYSLCVELARQNACSLDWLLLGEGTLANHTDGQSDWESAALDDLRSLSLADRQAALLFIKDKQRLQELERRLDRLASSVADIQPD
ncbi:transcriptional regulator [Pseudomonas putida]|uniref:helix-turn-helix domain-containing protein n=1 Tax=Pseudomonas putida group TaxID=136845 RepID=UPI00105A7A6F|nr:MULTISPECIES: helix-turn-helix domain-containing protein [Pseudomonas putida group]MBF8744933.1 helix-turn-helix domain-containing protein [Pseudomonas monteilii]TDJ73445.1 transcriptional regulator [Pseudomonas putida]